MLNLTPSLVFWGFSILSLLLFWKFGAFQLPASNKEGADSALRMRLTSVGLALFLYVFVASSVLQGTLKLLSWLPLHLKSQTMQALGQLVALASVLLVLFSFVRIHSQEMQDKIFGKSRGYKILLKGILLGIAVFPVIMLVELGLEYLITLVGSFEHHDQLAIQHLKNLKFNSWLFWTTVGFVVTVVPMTEELIFRGFLQNFFVDWLGTRFGIFASSLVFAAFHFAQAQGVSNIQMLSCIFILAYLLGVTYVKEKSLVASIGMHAAFNCLGVISLIFFDGALSWVVF
jgi:membrane protease YdiL (CAAX protease family)